LFCFNLRDINRQFTFVIEHDAPVIANARQLLTLVVDMETGQRGYVITGNQDFLEPYHVARGKFTDLIAVEKVLVSDNRSQVTRLQNIEASLQQWQIKAANPEIAMRRRILDAGAGSTNLQDMLSLGVGKDILDQIRIVAAEMEQQFRVDGNMHGVILLKSIQKCMVDQETGERGFLITGKEEFLEPYYEGRRELQHGFAGLRSLVAGAHDREATVFDLSELDRLTTRRIKEVIANRLSRDKSGTQFKKTFQFKTIPLEENSLVSNTNTKSKADGSDSAALKSELEAVNDELSLSKSMSENSPINILMTEFASSTGQQAPVTTVTTAATSADQTGQPAQPPAQAAPSESATPKKAAGSPTSGDTKKKPTETLRVDIERLDQLMNLAGELVISKARFSQIEEGLKGTTMSRQSVNAMADVFLTLDRLTSDIEVAEGKEEAHLSPEVLRNHMRRLRADLEYVDNGMKKFNAANALIIDLGDTVHQLDRVADGIQKTVMDTRMVPVGPLFRRFKRVIRDISHGNGKDIRLVINGENTELDKRMIDELGGPLIHMIRNCADHGIESPDDREAVGKPRQGTVTLDAYHRSNSILVEITDDGKGLAADKIRTKAIEKGSFPNWMQIS